MMPFEEFRKIDAGMRAEYDLALMLEKMLNQNAHRPQTVAYSAYVCFENDPDELE